MKAVFYFLVFPGFLFSAVVGLLASWVDRKLTARLQWRVGPPWYQPFVDLVKLLGKETILPLGAAKITYLSSPLIGLTTVTLVSTLLGMAILRPSSSFIGDLIVVLYLLIIVALAVIIGGFASANPFGSLGASREIKLLLGYELPFILAVLVPVIKAGGAIRMGELLTAQQVMGAVAGSISGVIAFIVAILCMQAKLSLVPFDIPEAETEIMSGPYIEYSGVTLAIFKLTRAMMLFVLPLFLVILFCAGIVISGWHIFFGILKYIGLLVLVILIRNTSPRVRIDQAIRFFWGPVTILAVVAVILAFMGL